MRVTELGRTHRVSQTAGRARDVERQHLAEPPATRLLRRIVFFDQAVIVNIRLPSEGIGPSAPYAAGGRNPLKAQLEDMMKILVAVKRAID